MTVINNPSKQMQNGDNVTVYNNTVGTVTETFTFPTSQETIILSNKGSKNITYTIGTNTGTLTPSTFVKVIGAFSSFSLSSEQGTQAFEVWSEEAGTLGVTTEAIRFSNTIGLIGDSITANNGAFDGYLFRSGYWSWANVFLGHRFNLTYMDGIPGSGCMDSTWQSRVDSIVKAHPSWVVVEIGTNDLFSNNTDTYIINSLTVSINKLRSAGIRPIICTVPPRNDLSSSQRTTRGKVNTWIKQLPSLYSGVVVVDISAYLTNPSSTTYGTYVASLSGDGVHPNAAGCRQIGLAFYDALNAITQPIKGLVFNQSEGNNTLPFNAVSWAGGSSAQPTGWTGTNTGLTWSQVNRTDNIQGIVQRVVVPNGGSVSLHVPFGGYAVGDQFVGFLELINTSGIEPSPASNTQGMTLYMVSYTSSYGIATATGDLYANGTEVNVAPPTSGILQTPVLTVPSNGLQEIDLFIDIRGGGTYDLGRVGVVKVN
jgi:lysophospholipase L1-like esterase